MPPLSSPMLRGLTKKIARAYSEGRLVQTMSDRLRPYLRGIRYLPHNPGSSVVIHAPAQVQPDQNDIPLVRRIWDSYRKMKQAERGAAACYRPSSFWQGILNEAYSNLSSGDFDDFHYFLANFGAWERDHGIETSLVVRGGAGSLLKRRYIQNAVFHRQLQTWRWFYGSRKPIERLSYPRHGNQSGAFVDGVFIGAASFFSEIYGSILAGLIDDLPRPTVAEIGGGYGKMIYFVLRDMKDFCYTDFDLPETLCLAAYYLMKTWPEKRALLYGEGDFSPSSYGRYALIFMPPFEIEKIGRSTVDLFINYNSFGEMRSETVERFLRFVTEATHYLFQMNHDTVPNRYEHGERGLLCHEYPIPERLFKLLFRFPEIGHMLYRGSMDETDIFFYLYERRAAGIPRST